MSAGVSWRELGKVLLTSPEDESGRKPAPAGVPGLGPAPQPGLLVTLSAPVALGKEGSQLQGAHLRHPPGGAGPWAQVQVARAPWGFCFCGWRFGADSALTLDFKLVFLL